MRKSKKHPRIANTRDLDLMRMYGFPPNGAGINVNDDDYYHNLGAALNWCSRGLDSKNAKKELLVWMDLHKFPDDDIIAIKALHDQWLGHVGRFAFLINNDWPMPTDILDRMNKKITALAATGKTEIENKNAEMRQNAKIIAIKNETATSRNLKNLIAGYDIADFIEDMLFSEFMIDETVIASKMKGKTSTVLDITRSKLTGILNEIQLIGVEADVTEAYSHIKKANIKKIIAGLERACGIAQASKINKAVYRKAKARKPKSAVNQVKNVNYQQSDETYNLISENPVNIIKAMEIVVFNTKKKKLGIYVSRNLSGFGVKGSSITNFDSVMSQEKTLRGTKENSVTKKLEAFRAIKTKPKREKFFKLLTTKSNSLTGRLNKDTIILKIIK